MTAFCIPQPWRLGHPPMHAVPRGDAATLKSYSQKPCQQKLLGLLKKRGRTYASEQRGPQNRVERDGDLLHSDNGKAHEDRHRNLLSGGLFRMVGAGGGLSTILLWPSSCNATANATASYLNKPQSAQYVYHMVNDQTVCFACIALGVCFSLLTLAVTGRFLLSL